MSAQAAPGRFFVSLGGVCVWLLLLHNGRDRHKNDDPRYQQSERSPQERLLEVLRCYSVTFRTGLFSTALPPNSVTVFFFGPGSRLSVS